MNIQLNVTFDNFSDLRDFLAGAGGQSKSAAPATVAAAPAAEANPPTPPAKKAKDKAPDAAAAKAAAEQAEIDGNTNAGCIVMIKRVAAMDGKDEKGNDKATGLAKATSIIQSHGGCKVSELPKDKWAAFIADCKKTLTEPAAAAAPADVKELF